MAEAGGRPGDYPHGKVSSKINCQKDKLQDFQLSQKQNKTFTLLTQGLH